MRQDITFALRTFRKNPGFTAVVIVSIALGIAANTTVFSIVNGLLFGMLPVRDAQQLVSFNGGSTMSWPDYVDYRDQAREMFTGVSAHFPLVPASVGGQSEPERIWGQLATANYFDVIGVDLAMGRGFLADEDKVPGRNNVVVLSHALWTRRFHADPNMLGRNIYLNGLPYQVIGVTRRGYAGSDRGLITEFWAPISMLQQLVPDMKMDRFNQTSSRTSHWLVLNGRLRPGITRDQAAAAVNVIQSRIDDQFRKGEKRRKPIELTTAGALIDGIGRKMLPLLAVMMTVVGLVLLIACASVANLLLARAAARQKEIGLRLAVGASSSRLLRQLLTESVLLSSMGAIAGFLLAWWAAMAISAFPIPIPIPIAFDFTPDARVLAFTAAMAFVTGIIFGLLPALRATRPDLVSALKSELSADGRASKSRMRNALVVVQVALSVVLLVGAGLFLRSLSNAAGIDTGMKPDGVLLMAFDPKLNQYTPQQTRQMLSQLRDRVEAQPGVTAVSFLDSVPLSIGGTSFDFKLQNSPTGPKELNADVYYVGQRFFETMGIPIIRGREFNLQPDSDGSVAIINEAMAQRLFGSEDPVGRTIYSEKKPFLIAGIAKNAKSRTLGEDPANCAYLFLEAKPEEVLSFYGISIAVRSAGNAAGLQRSIRQEILALDSRMAVFNSQTMREHVDKALMLPRVSATLLAVFGVTGLVLAAIGLYGVMSYSVRSRTKEIGIRIALGAGRGRVLSSLTQQGVLVAGAGLGIGLALAWAGSRVVASFLYGLSPADPVTFMGVALVLIATSALAVLIPARRAARVDPLIALRHE
jgi:predicted permease